MAFNDIDTNGKYCPFCGFEPPCGLCMFAVESEYGLVACAIPVMAMAIEDDGLYIKNAVHHRNEDYKNIPNDSNYEEQK